MFQIRSGLLHLVATEPDTYLAVRSCVGRARFSVQTGRHLLCDRSSGPISDAADRTVYCRCHCTSRTCARTSTIHQVFRKSPRMTVQELTFLLDRNSSQFSNLGRFQFLWRDPSVYSAHVYVVSFCNFFDFVGCSPCGSSCSHNIILIFVFGKNIYKENEDV